MNILRTSACVLSLLLSLTAHAQAFPDRPIHFIVPFTAGSATDVVARTVGEMMSRSLKQPIVVENRPGAGGTLGAAQVAKSNPDGYTLLIPSAGHIANPAIYASLPYDTLRDFAGVTQRSPLLPDVPTTTEVGYAQSDYVFWVASAEVKEKLATPGAEPMPMAPAAFDEFLKNEAARMAQVVKGAGIKVQ